MPPKRPDTGEPRDFPYKDKAGRWRHPKTGRLINRSTAKATIKRTERKILINNLADATGRSIPAIKKALKGVPTVEIVGRWKYRNKRNLQQVRTSRTKRARKALRKLGVTVVSSRQLLRY